MNLDFYERKITPSMLEKREMAYELEIKSIDAAGRFAGYASVFDHVDSQRDVVEKGAFTETLKDRVHDIKLLWQHQLVEPVGYFIRMFEDMRGLYVEGQLMLEVERAREAHALLQQGVVKGLSIGFTPIRYHIDPDTGVRHLTKVALYEVSLVTMPANAHSQVSVVKSRPVPAWDAKNEKVLEGALDKAFKELLQL